MAAKRGSICAHELGHNLLGEAHSRVAGNLMGESITIPSDDDRRFLTDRPAVTADQKRQACDVLEARTNKIRWQRKDCPPTRWNALRADLEAEDRRHKEEEEKIDEAYRKISQERDALDRKITELKGKIAELEKACEEARAILGTSVDDYVQEVLDDLREYKKLDEDNALNDEDKERLRGLKRDYRTLVSKLNRNKRRDDRFPAKLPTLDEVKGVLESNLRNRNGIFQEYRERLERREEAERELADCMREKGELERELTENSSERERLSAAMLQSSTESGHERERHNREVERIRRQRDARVY